MRKRSHNFKNYIIPINCIKLQIIAVILSYTMFACVRTHLSKTAQEYY